MPAFVEGGEEFQVCGWGICGQDARVPSYIRSKPQLLPLFPLRVVGGDLRVERLGNTAERDAPLRLDHKLLLQPQFLLEILELSEEGDDLACDLADDLDLGEILLDARHRLVLHVVQVHDFVLDVEIEFPAQERPEILVDEVIEGIARGVAPEVCLQPGGVGLLAARRDVRLAELGDPRRQRSPLTPALSRKGRGGI